MYEELITNLRNCAETNSLSLYKRELMEQAADAIEELSKRVPPVPHGRLIDADELKKKHHWTDDYYETEYVEVEDIDAAPTIILAEEGE